MDNVRTYFNSEKRESLLFILIGLIGIGFGAYFLISVKKMFYSGASLPLIIAGIIQIIIGTIVYLRSPKDIIRVEKIIEEGKEMLNSTEVPRMKRVMKNFHILLLIEIILILAGLLIMFIFQNAEFLNGLGVGLFIQSAISLNMDFFAEKRGQEYLNYLMSAN